MSAFDPKQTLEDRHVLNDIKRASRNEWARAAGPNQPRQGGSQSLHVMAEPSVLPLTLSVNPHNESWLLNLDLKPLRSSGNKSTGLHSDENGFAVALGLGRAAWDYRRRNRCCVRAAYPHCGRDLGALAQQEATVRNQLNFFIDEVTCSSEPIPHCIITLKSWGGLLIVQGRRLPATSG